MLKKILSVVNSPSISKRVKKIGTSSVQTGRLRLQSREAFKGAINLYQQQRLPWIEKELNSSNEVFLFISYFLKNYDICDFAQSTSFYHVGRGSGANPASWPCLGITVSIPLSWTYTSSALSNLYQENPPDFDIDFSWTDRDTVTSIFSKLQSQSGQDMSHCSAPAAPSVNSMIRELGKGFLGCQK
jgi:DNA polymerase-3 subunit alpha